MATTFVSTEYVAGGDERGRPGNWAASFFAAVNAISAACFGLDAEQRKRLVVSERD